jgi:inorganic pyrophosphatase
VGSLALVPDSLRCLIEIPKGSRNKYEYDEALGGIKLARFLFSSVVYPSDYGFIPETVGEDGDHLDALVLVERPTFPGCVIEVRAIGALRLSDDAGQDDKIICVPCNDPHWSDLEALDDISPQLRTEIEHFFSIYKQPEGKDVEIQGFVDRDVAHALIDAARERFSSPDPG